MRALIDIQDEIDLLQMNREEEYKKSLSSECEHKSVIRSKHDAHVAFCDYLIECVKQLPTHPTPSNMLGALDCVERQAAIDEIDEWIKAFRENGHKESAADACLIQDGIIQLPSVQHEQELLKDGTLVVKTNFDMTKFDRINVIQNGTHYGDLFYQDDDTRRKGKWIRTRTMTHDGELYCDQCEQEHPEQKIIWNFCPNCGADMRPRGDSE